ncbi:MAG: thioredoxin family protein [Spirochaetales bacterium]|nr:thioredoxin family protein [Spirochaetales bacterium]
MTIQILGTGCPKCRALESSARQAVQELGTEIAVEKVEDVERIMEMGVMMTPALVIDGKLISEGKLLSKDQVLSYL